MGSFDRLGFYSKLPISCGDEMVLFVCADTSKFNHNRNGICDMADDGIVPIAAPFICKYNDYGTGVDFVQDANYNLFKEKFGMTIEEFENIIFDLSGYNILDCQKGLDDLKKKNRTANNYHHETKEDFKNMISLIKKIIHPKIFELPKRNITKQEKQTWDGLNEWLYDRFLHCGFITIIEHKFVYDKFIDAYKKSRYFTDASQRFDMMNEYINGFREVMGKNFKGFNFLKHRIEPFLDVWRCPKKYHSKLEKFTDAFEEKYKHVKDRGWGLTMESCLHCTIRDNFEDHALYDNFTGDMTSMKDAILDYIYFIRGFGFTHSVFAPSELAGQETEYDILLPVYEEMYNHLKTEKERYESYE